VRSRGVRETFLLSGGGKRSSASTKKEGKNVNALFQNNYKRGGSAGRALSGGVKNRVEWNLPKDSSAFFSGGGTKALIVRVDPKAVAF